MQIRGTLVLTGLHPQISGMRLYFPKHVVRKAPLTGTDITVNFDQKDVVGKITSTYWEGDTLKFIGDVIPGKEEYVKMMQHLRLSTAPTLVPEIVDKTQYKKIAKLDIQGVSLTSSPTPTYAGQCFDIIQKDAWGKEL